MIVAVVLGWVLNRFVLIEELDRREKLLDSAWPG